MSPLERRLTEALRSICPPGVRVGVRTFDETSVADLGPTEGEAVAGAGARRRCEFATGRALLRDLLPGVGDIGVLPNRAPALPPGLRASLAHDDEVVVAVVASAVDGIAALGVDLEPHPSFDADEADLVRRPDEADHDPGLVFVLKEAAYKAWANGGGELLEFAEVRVHVDHDTFVADVRDGARLLSGRYRSVAGRWLAVAVDHDTPLPA